MSAYIVTDELISALVASPVFEGMDRNKIGQVLVNENYRSVNFRYRENETPHTFKFVIPSISTKDMADLVDEYDYQACETEDYHQSLAYKFITWIKNNH